MLNTQCNLVTIYCACLCFFFTCVKLIINWTLERDSPDVIFLSHFTQSTKVVKINEKYENINSYRSIFFVHHPWQVRPKAQPSSVPFSLSCADVRSSS